MQYHCICKSAMISIVTSDRRRNHAGTGGITYPNATLLTDPSPHNLS